MHYHLTSCGVFLDFLGNTNSRTNSREFGWLGLEQELYTILQEKQPLNKHHCKIRSPQNQISVTSFLKVGELGVNHGIKWFPKGPAGGFIASPLNISLLNRTYLSTKNDLNC